MPINLWSTNVLLFSQSWIVLGTVGKVFLTVYKAVVDRIAKQRHPRVRFVFYVPRQINEPNLRTESLLLKDILNHPALEGSQGLLFWFIVKTLIGFTFSTHISIILLCRCSGCAASHPIKPRMPF